MEELNYLTIKKYIEKILQLVENNIGKELANFIKHYIAYDEYEMAFEILFIEIMKMKKKPKLDCEMNIRIGKQLGLDKESIYDDNFWCKFIEMNKKLCSASLGSLPPDGT